MEIKIISYLGDFSNPAVPDKEILFSLRRKFKVKAIDVRKFKFDKKLIKQIINCDLFLFHGQMAELGKTEYYIILDRLKGLLEGTNAIKVLWLLDKVWGTRISTLLDFYNSVDYVFVSDETWLKRFETDKIFPLHPAASERKITGKYNKKFACDIAFFGGVYGQREIEIKFLKERFGGRMKVFNNNFVKDLADLCKSTKLIYIPMYPFDDFFWSDRIYKILQYGGLPICQRSYGLFQQGFIENRHYFTFSNQQELFVTVNMLLDNKAKKIRKQVAKEGRNFVLQSHTYKNRIEEIINKINENPNKPIYNPIPTKG